MTEVRQYLSYYFLLSADDLRKLCELMITRINSVQNSNTQNPNFKVEFQDGYLQKFNSVDEVLQIENEGSKKIHKLNIEIFTTSSNSARSSYEISIEFKDSSNHYSDTSIIYHIEGEDQNWVFLTESQIKQKLNKVKIWRPTQLLNQVFNPGLSIVIIGSLFLMLSIFNNSSNNLSQSKHSLEVLESEYKNGKIKDPVEAIILFEQIKIKSNEESTINITINYGWITALILIIIGVIAYFYYFPAYNFYWGDYIKEYRKKTSIGYTILVVVLLGILISVFSNWLSKKLGI